MHAVFVIQAMSIPLVVSTEATERLSGTGVTVLRRWSTLMIDDSLMSCMIFINKLSSLIRKLFQLPLAAPLEKNYVTSDIGDTRQPELSAQLTTLVCVILVVDIGGGQNLPQYIGDRQLETHHRHVPKMTTRKVTRDASGSRVIEVVVDIDMKVTV